MTRNNQNLSPPENFTLTAQMEITLDAAVGIQQKLPASADSAGDQAFVDTLMGVVQEVADVLRAVGYLGDSGSPSFLIINGMMVVLGLFHAATGGSFVSGLEYALINNALAALGDPMRLTDADLSPFTTYST